MRLDPAVCVLPTSPSSPQAAPISTKHSRDFHRLRFSKGRWRRLGKALTSHPFLSAEAWAGVRLMEKKRDALSFAGESISSCYLLCHREAKQAPSGIASTVGIHAPVISPAVLAACVVGGGFELAAASRQKRQEMTMERTIAVMMCGKPWHMKREGHRLLGDGDTNEGCEKESDGSCWLLARKKTKLP